MSSWFLLPCSCGKSIRILPRHAGESRTCECGETIVAPSMREIRRLESIEDETVEAAAPPSNWSAWRRALFVFGIPIFLIGAGIAINAYRITSRYRPIHVTKPTVEQVRATVNLEVMKVDIDSLNPLETLEQVWKPLLKEQLQQYQEHPYIGYRRARDGYRNILKWSSLAAGVGLLLTLIPLLIPGKGRSSQ